MLNDSREISPRLSVGEMQVWLNAFIEGATVAKRQSRAAVETL